MNQILRNSDLHICSLASLEASGRQVAFIEGNRPTAKNNIKQKELSLQKFGVNLTPLVYIDGNKVIKNGNGKLHLAMPKTGQRIDDSEASNYIVIIDGQHRYLAARNINLDPNNIILMEDYSGQDAQELIARINNETYPWVTSEWAYGARMFNPENPVAQFAEKLARKGFKGTTIGLILYFRKGVLGKKAFADLMNGKDAEKGFDIKRAEDFLAVALDKFELKFVQKRYLIDVVSELSVGRDYKLVLDAVGKLTENNVSQLMQTKSDDKEREIREMLTELITTEQVS